MAPESADGSDADSMAGREARIAEKKTSMCLGHNASVVIPTVLVIAYLALKDGAGLRAVTGVAIWMVRQVLVRGEASRLQGADDQRNHARPRSIGQVIVSVIDSGPGIAKAERERMFDPFSLNDPLSRGLRVALVARSRFVEDVLSAEWRRVCDSIWSWAPEQTRLEPGQIASTFNPASRAAA